MKNQYINKVNDKSKKNPIFRIEKDFSVYSIEAIKSEINELIENFKNFHLEIIKPDNIDLTAVQLILALKNELGERFTYTLDLKEEQKLLFKHAGLDKYINF